MLAPRGKSAGPCPQPVAGDAQADEQPLGLELEEPSVCVVERLNSRTPIVAGGQNIGTPRTGSARGKHPAAKPGRCLAFERRIKGHHERWA